MAKERKRFEFTKDLDVNDRFDFTKDDGESYSKVQVDLSWISELDLDALAFLVGDDGIINDDADFVYYKSNSRWLPADENWKDPELREDVDVTEGDFQPFDKTKFKTAKVWREHTIPVSKDGSVIGSWDDPGNDDDDEEESGETMHINLDKISEDVAEVVICASIHPNKKLAERECNPIPEAEQTFDKVKEAKIELTDEETGNILCTFNLKADFAGKTAVEVGKLAINDEGEWAFQPISEGHDGGIQTLAEIYA